MDEVNPEDYVLQYYTVVGDQNVFLQKTEHNEVVQYDEDELQEEDENQIMYITVNEDNDEEVVNTAGSDSNTLLSVNDSLGVIYPTVSNMFVTTEDGQIYLTQNVLTDGSLIPCQSDELANCEVQEDDEEQLDVNTNFTTDFQDDDNSADICQGTNYQEIQLEDGICAIIDSDLLKSIIEKSNNFSANKNTHNNTTIEEPKTKKWSRKWVCEYVGCGKVYSTSHHLSVHKRVHTGSRPFKCTHCVKTFTTGYSLKSHLRIHTGEKPYPCKVCPKQFKTSGDLQKHNRIHTGEKPFMCPIEGCGKSFTTSNIRKVHIRSHTGERPYVCSTCKKGFSSATNHKNHIRIHSGEKPYVCAVIGCGKRFTEYSSLYKHNFVHQQTRPFNCSYCPMSFKQESSLKTHKIGEHDVVFGDDGSEIIYSKFGLSLKYESKVEDNENEDEDEMEVF